MRETVEIVKCDICGKKTEKREYKGSLKVENICNKCMGVHLFSVLMSEIHRYGLKGNEAYYEDNMEQMKMFHDLERPECLREE
jgi:hypothetical protein